MTGPVLVTGAAGNVGNAVVDLLEKENLQVIANTRKLVSNKKTFVADLVTEPEALETLPDDLSAIIHMACYLPEGNDKDEHLANLNTLLDDHIYKFAKKRNVPTIYASSCGLYDCDGALKDENSTTITSAPYFKSKKMGEDKFLTLKGSCALRICAPISPLNTKSIVYRFIETAYQKKTILLHGSGKREQDFIDTRDIANFVLLALQKKLTGVFNIASGRAVTMESLANQIVKELKQGDWQYSRTKDAQEHRKACFSIEKAKNEGWEPVISLSQTIQDIIKEVNG